MLARTGNLSSSEQSETFERKKVYSSKKKSTLFKTKYQYSCVSYILQKEIMSNISFYGMGTKNL